jgi:hypothetical protein
MAVKQYSISLDSILFRKNFEFILVPDVVSSHEKLFFWTLKLVP